jgi:hypothetical protein
MNLAMEFFLVMDILKKLNKHVWTDYIQHGLFIQQGRGTAIAAHSNNSKTGTAVVHQIFANNSAVVNHHEVTTLPSQSSMPIERREAALSSTGISLQTPLSPRLVPSAVFIASALAWQRKHMNHSELRQLSHLYQ